VVPGAGGRPESRQRRGRHRGRAPRCRGRLQRRRVRARTQGPGQGARLRGGGEGPAMSDPTMRPDEAGRFGPYGGRFVPETLMEPLRELEAAYLDARRDPAFRAELAARLRDYVGRPTPLSEAERLSARLGCRVLLKREDLCHTGAHKIN